VGWGGGRRGRRGASSWSWCKASQKVERWVGVAEGVAEEEQAVGVGVRRRRRKFREILGE
jgi:hypothetical protein